MDVDFRRIDSLVLDFISKYRYPSITLGLLYDDSTYFKGYGYRDIEEGVAADEKTLYGIGSITKSFTALSIMQLYEKSLLRLDDPICKYINSEVKIFKECDFTIHHLLTHSSGIPALGYAEAFINGLTGLTDEWLPITKPEEIISFMDNAHKWRLDEAGRSFYYLNEGYVLLGIIISRLTGLSYEEYVRENILKPLKMDRSYFKREDILRDGNLATPYVFDDDNKPVKSSFPFGITSDGGLVSNVVDMVNYIRMYLARGIFGDREIVSRDSIEKMEKPYIKLPYQVLGGESYGYGLMITPNFCGYKLIGHGGSILVHTAYMGYIPGEDIGIVLLSNGSLYNLSYLAMAVLAMLLGKDPYELPFIKYEEILSKLAGVYHTYKKTMKAVVEKKGSILYIKFKDRYREELIPLFPVKIRDDKVVFKTNQGWREYEVEFNISDKLIDFIYERYRFIKSI